MLIVNDKVVGVVAHYNGHLFSQRWYYNMSVRDAIEQYKAVNNLTGKHGVEIIHTS